MCVCVYACMSVHVLYVCTYLCDCTWGKQAHDRAHRCVFVCMHVCLFMFYMCVLTYVIVRGASRLMIGHMSVFCVYECMHTCMLIEPIGACFVYLCMYVCLYVDRAYRCVRMYVCMYVFRCKHSVY